MSSRLISRLRYLNSIIDPQYELVFLGTQGGDAFFCFLARNLFQHADSPPHRRRADPRHIARCHQQLHLIGFQCLGWFRRLRPPHESSAGETLLGQPVSLAVIAEDSNRGPTAAPKHEHTAGKRILRQFLLAEPRERVYAFSSIDRLNGHQHPHLRRDLNHLSAFRQARSRLAQSGGAAAFHWMRTLPPRKDSNSMTHSLGVAACGAISSTNAGLLAFRRSRGTPPSRFFSPT